jgi:hypothetical protein
MTESLLPCLKHLLTRRRKPDQFTPLEIFTRWVDTIVGPMEGPLAKADIDTRISEMIDSLKSKGYKVTAPKAD